MIFCLLHILQKRMSLFKHCILCSETNCRQCFFLLRLACWVSNGRKNSYLTIHHMFKSKSFVFTSLKLLMRSLSSKALNARLSFYGYLKSPQKPYMNAANFAAT